jgi:integrase
MNPKVFIRYEENGLYYTRFAVRGKRYLYCTKTDEKRIAQMRAKQYRDAVVAEQYGLVDGMKTGGQCPTIGEVLAAFEALPIPVAQNTRKRARSAFLRMLKADGLGVGDRMDRVGKQTVLKYQTQQLGLCMGILGDSDSQKTQRTAPGVPSSAIVSTNSTVRQARILFARRAMAFYPDELGLPRHKVAEFMGVPLMPLKNQGIRPLPDPAAMARAEDPLTGLPQHKPEWCGYLLAKYAGMRPKEIMGAQWSWLRGDSLAVGGWDGVAGTKTGRFRFLRLAPDVIDMLRANKTDDTYIVGKSPRPVMRVSLVIMLRAFGFTMVDPIYSLRRWHASWRYENQGSPSARDALGHTTESTTMRHYARMLNAPAAIPFNGQALPALPAAPSQ